MDSDSIMLRLPFDEPDGSSIAYDTSRSRADGAVDGASFVAGKNGNAISFDDCSGTCEVSGTTLSSMSGNFTILAWVQSHDADCGAPSKMIWLLAFSGMENCVEVPIECAPGTWYCYALTRDGDKYCFYVNSNLVQTVTNSGTLQGVSLNQDYYGGDYGFGMLDDVVIYDLALTQEEMISVLPANKRITYTVDGVDFKTYGVYVSASSGVVDFPKLKTPASLSWDNYHGESVDLQHKYFEPREITLSCFVKAESKMDFVKQLAGFRNLFMTKGANRLVIGLHPVKPLIYEVYCKDAIEVTKTWSDDLMVGTFKLKLTEPEPVKRVLKHIRLGEATKTCTVRMSTSKYVNIYWGDGSVDFSVSGTDVEVSHDYGENGDYFPVITGCIDEITEFTTNAIVVWQKI